MSVFESVIRVFAPHTCLGCTAEEDRLLCEACCAGIALIPSRCYLCATATDYYAVCSSCMPRTPLGCVVVCTSYRDLAKKLIRCVKYDRAQAGVHEMASMLLGYEDFDEITATAIFTHVPTATSRVRMRGYDQAALLGAELARQLARPYKRLLARVGQAHQVGAGRAARKSQLQNAFRPLSPDLIRGKHIVLVDDVLTTGATLEAAARTLKDAGASQVDAIVFAQA